MFSGRSSARDTKISSQHQELREMPRRNQRMVINRCQIAIKSRQMMAPPNQHLPLLPRLQRKLMQQKVTPCKRLRTRTREFQGWSNSFSLPPWTAGLVNACSKFYSEHFFGKIITNFLGSRFVAAPRTHYSTLLQETRMSHVKNVWIGYPPNQGRALLSTMTQLKDQDSFFLQNLLTLC